MADSVGEDLVEGRAAPAAAALEVEDREVLEALGAAVEALAQTSSTATEAEMESNYSAMRLLRGASSMRRRPRLGSRPP